MSNDMTDSVLSLRDNPSENELAHTTKQHLGWSENYNIEF